MRNSLIACLAILLLACGASHTPEFKPFDLDYSATSGSPADMRFLLSAPAGGDGFVTVKDGHLARGDGSRLRIWGVNTSFSGSLPSKEDAARYADLLARHGINSIRVHHCDRPWPRGLIDGSDGTTRKLHPEALDRLDFFVAELKKRGIYTNLNLNVSRPFTEADGVQDADKIGYGKGLTYFDPTLIRLQKEYARQLLTHKNAYTGNEYRMEPAIVMVEMVNENSLIQSWMRGRLRGTQTTPTQTTWTDIPPSYAADLDRLYNNWLKRERPYLLGKLREEAGVKAGEFVPRLCPEDMQAASAERFQTEAEFYMSLESGFFEAMGNYLREELGVRQLLVGTSSHSGSLSPYPLLSSTSTLDVVDGHTYWQHPSYKRDPETGERISWTIKNTPMVNDPLHSTVQALARNAVAGMPYMTSEVNHPWPAEYAAEGIPILAAYGALQDWDAIYHYSYSHTPPAEWEPGPTGFFDIRSDPVKMSQVAAGALVFLRGDVSVARETLVRNYSRTQVIESLRLPETEAPFFDPAYSPALTLMHATRIGTFDGEPTDFSGSAESPIRSDTGELAWRYSADGDGLVTIDAPRSQGLVGFVKANAIETTHLRAEVANEFCAVLLQSLDGEPIARSSKLLLTTGARTGTTGMEWNEERTTLVEEGGAPVTIETVVGRFVFKGLEGAGDAEVVPLDEAGRAARPAKIECAAGECMVDIDADQASPWYVISVNR